MNSSTKYIRSVAVLSALVLMIFFLVAACGEDSSQEDLNLFIGESTTLEYPPSVSQTLAQLDELENQE